MNKEKLMSWLEREKQVNKEALSKAEQGSFARVGFAERLYIINKTQEYIMQDEIIQSDPETCKECDDHWKRESISDKSKLGLLRLWFGSKGMDMDKTLEEINKQVK